MLFAGHETFHIRDGWMHKGLNAVTEDPMIFSNPHATDVLGVGRNMVNAIRYWLVANGLATEEKETIDSRPKTRLTLTDFGELVARFDPYFEEDLTLWVVHYNMATNKDKATTWFWLFNKFPMTRFDTQTCLNYLTRWVTQQYQKRNKQVALPSLQKDIKCIGRTYTSPVIKNKKESPEDTFECPLSALRLVDYLENTGSYKLNVGKRLLPPAVMAYSVHRFLELEKEKANEIGFKELLSSEFSPGRVFLLSSDGLLENLDTLQNEYGKKRFSYSRTAGMNLLRVGEESSLDILKEAYEKIGDRS
jgi:hypothetical protein